MDRRDFLTIGAPRSREAIRGESRGVTAARDASQTPPAFARRSDTDLTTYSGSWTYKQAAHLLRRSTFGPTEAEINQAVADGMEATIDKLFTPWEPPLDGIDSWANATNFQALPDTANGEDFTTFQQKQYERRDLFIRWILLSMQHSPVSIQERLRLFWHNHFTSEVLVVNYPELIYEQYKLFKQHMFGNFKEFTYDISIDMAMLIYLDGIKNYKTTARNNINENYARELMELFTMGVFDWEGNENYSQDDVIAAAHSLSGWQYNVDNPRNILFVDRKAVFKSLWWDNGQKTLMGQTGAWNTQDVIDIIFAQRGDQIAKYICEKIYRGFVYDVADRVVVEQMANAFRAGNWELRPVFEMLLKSEHFYDETNIGAMHKGPIDYMVGMIREMDITTVPGLDDLANARANRDLGGRLQSLGQVPYYPPNVKGWPGGRTWTSTSTLPIRQKFGIDVGAENISLQRKQYYLIDPIEFAKQFSDPYDVQILTDEMSRFLLNTEPSEKEADLLFQTILDGGVDYEWDLDDPNQRPEERIRKFLQAIAQLAKFQLY
ncbi:MAG: DUF1800 domain-containing protein [Ignavibacteriae bacterium]|nr:DUF1800 domain-containing protein [Ignavibacteriota bacterium]MCB9217759.1 DUF1800 domain-containing protein [Ignavibacteria bacterium]